MSVDHKEREERAAFGFTRTICGCKDCVTNCKYLPGYLIPEDVEKIARHLGYTNLFRFALDNLLASPGATVMHEGQVFQIPTLVPQRKRDGSCKFLDENDHCRIHSVSPFGCAFFDSHQPDSEANRRSGRGLQEIARHWSVRTSQSTYTLLWRMLYALKLRAMPAHLARKKMKEALEG